MDNESLIDTAIIAELEPLYRAEDRHYHGMAHIAALLALAQEHAGSLSDREAVLAALWFHDAIYDSRRADNEARSAALARDRLRGRCDPARLARIAAMIGATATHAVPDMADAASRQDAAFFLDMDLSILGSPPYEFDAYEQAIRREYAWVEDAAWRQGRGAVLRRFLSRHHIFHTQPFRRRYEQQARINIARSLALLSA